MMTMYDNVLQCMTTMNDTIFTKTDDDDYHYHYYYIIIISLLFTIVIINLTIVTLYYCLLLTMMESCCFCIFWPRECLVIQHDGIDYWITESLGSYKILNETVWRTKICTKIQSLHHFPIKIIWTNLSLSQKNQRVSRSEKKKVLNSSPRPVRLLGPVGSSWVKLHGRKLGVKGFLDPNLTLRRIQCGAFHKKGACKQLQCHYGWCVYKSNNYG